MVPARRRLCGRSAKVGRGNPGSGPGKRDRPGRAGCRAGAVRMALSDQARVARAWLKVADGRMTAAAFAGSGW